jgi:hypothetical protein
MTFASMICVRIIGNNELDLIGSASFRIIVYSTAKQNGKLE